MTNQFFYTRKDDDGSHFIDSFNIERVLRTMQDRDGNLEILLDDLHERVFEIPIINPKTNKPTGGVTRKRDMTQSQIKLVGDDVTRFKQLTEIV
jgi:hypothetical protein